jgi:hypothetical protein
MCVLCAQGGSLLAGTLGVVVCQQDHTAAVICVCECLVCCHALGALAGSCAAGHVAAAG